MGNNNSGLKKGEIDKLTKTTNFDKNEINRLHEDFKKTDTDKSGELDKQEFRPLFEKYFKIKDDTLYNEFFQAFDEDKNGTISFKELATALSILGKGDPKEKLKFMFHLYDEDNSGTLDASEVKKIIDQMIFISKGMGKEETSSAAFAEGLMKKLDADGDGVITEQGSEKPKKKKKKERSGF